MMITERSKRVIPFRPDEAKRVGEDCFYLKVFLRSIDELGALLDRFLVYGETTTSLINASPIPRRDPPLEEQV